MAIDLRAYLRLIRNITRGLITRTKIIAALDYDEWKTVSEIASEVEVGPSTVRYHLNNMKEEQIVEKEEDGPGWCLEEGQKKITDWFPSSQEDDEELD
ncbi:MAG: winged helix-turn-helix transcriptional regulator [Candidatus Thorarchaeota archaeon]|nr:winged helix-turn-helix transcriptional regulator [Candidatus Thorarchaeota archaeon]